MNTITSRLIGIGVLFLIIFVSGYWLSRSGKPYPVILFTLHKLIALGAVIFLAVMVSKIHPSAPLQSVEIIGITITAIILAATIVTGGLTSVDKAMPAAIHTLHRIAPYLSVVSVSMTIYLLIQRSSALIHP